VSLVVAVAVAAGAVDGPDLDAEASHHAPLGGVHHAPLRAVRRTHSAARPARWSVVTVGGLQKAPAVRSGFLGLSLEFSTVEAYAGTNPAALDPVFVQLIRNISPGQRPSIRIGGDSTDWAWVPVPTVHRPPGIRIDLNPRWLRVTHALAATLNANMMLGINLEADNAGLAADEARAFVSRIGRVRALELGNEPELYHAFPWYTNADRRAVPGRGSGWSFASYVRDYATIASGLPRVPLAGPASGAPAWVRDAGGFAAAERRGSTVTVHRYPLQRCGLPSASSRAPTIAQLLSRASSGGLAATVAPVARAAHLSGDSIRVDELNSVTCGGAGGVSNVFASALWIVDTLFGMARAGVDGVNIHTFNKAIYGLFEVRHVRRVWSADVRPDYYGLLLFARAAPPGSHLLGVAGANGSLRVWATQGPDRRTRVVLINDDPEHRRQIAIRLPGGRGGGTLERLLAPSLRARSGVTLAGQSFGAATTTGRLGGSPRVTAVNPRRGAFRVSLPAASAALLTLR
jgi:hypothetical protein